MPFSYPFAALISRTGLRLMTIADATFATGSVFDLEHAVSRTTISIPSVAEQRTYALTHAVRSTAVEADFALVDGYPQ